MAGAFKMHIFTSQKIGSNFRYFPVFLRSRYSCSPLRFYNGTYLQGSGMFFSSKRKEGISFFFGFLADFFTAFEANLSVTTILYNF